MNRDGIIACYCHLPSAIRSQLHQAVVRDLKPGGVFVLETFSQGQIDYDTGGPKSLDMLMKLAELTLELSGLDFIHGVELEREVHEGRGHNGLAAVVQIFAVNL